MEDSINDKMMTVMSKVHSVDFCHSVLLYVLLTLLPNVDNSNFYFVPWFWDE